MTNAEAPRNTTGLTIAQALQQAIACHEVGKLQEAERLYRTILQAQPNQPDANHNLGVLAVQVKKPAESLPYFKAALDANPNQNQYWLSYIDILIQTDQFDAARGALNQAWQRGFQGKAEEALAARLSAAVQVANKLDGRHLHASSDSLPVSSAPPQNSIKTTKAERTKTDKSTKKVIPHNKKNPSPQDINAVVALFSEERYTEAATLAQAMTVRFPLHEFGWTILGIVFNKLGRSAEALAPLQRAIALSPGFAEAHFNLGHTFADLGRLDDSEASYRRALKFKPNYAEAHVNLGATLKELGRPNEAEASFRRALDINPDFAEANSNLGNILKDLSRFDEAMACHQRALEINPNYTEAHSNLGLTFMDLGRLDEAMACHQRALEINPNYAEAHSNLGIALKELGRLEESEASHRRALAIKSDFSGAHSNLGSTLSDSGRHDEAEACFRRALEIKPNFAEVHSNLGNALKEQGRLDEAEASYRRALQINPNYADALYNLGDLLSYIGDLNQEISAYQHAFIIAPQKIGLSAAVMLAVRRYLEGNFSECRKLLSGSSPIIAKAESNFKTPRAYWSLLNLLLASHDQVPEMSKASNNAGTLYVIGESHSLPAHHTTVSYGGHPMHCVAQWIAGCKQWHLGDGKANRYKYRHKFEMIMARLPQQSTILLTIGEIDCRPTEGIIKALRKSPETSLEALCQSTSGAYLRYVTEIGTRYGHRIVVAGVPAPRISEVSVSETSAQHIRLIRTFNKILRDLVLAARMDFLDLYSLTDSGDGIASGEWHIDTHHLSPTAMIEAFDRHCLHESCGL
jgi:tetratricopeptide (TPR) repeat protein